MLRALLDRVRVTTTRHAEPERPAPVLALSTVETSLALYAKALSGGLLRIAPGPSNARRATSDGRTIFLPPALPAEPSPEHARRRYQLMTAWATLQVRAGCLEHAPVPPEAPLGALSWYAVLHGEWIDRRLQREWPGLTSLLREARRAAAGKDTAAPDTPLHPLERTVRTLLALPLEQPLTETWSLHAAATPLPPDTWSTLLRVLDSGDPAELASLSSELAVRVPVADEAIPLPAHWAILRGDLLVRLSHAQGAEPPGRDAGSPPPGRPASRRGDPMVVEARAPTLVPRRARGSTRGGRQAVQLSLGDREAPPTAARRTPLSDAEKAGATLYPEWDYWSGTYLSEWCAVREVVARGGNVDAVERILRQHRPLVQQLRRQFEALRPERLRLTRQLDGDELDLAALVEAAADHHAGLGPSEKVYSTILQRERSVALACLVDLSGSTGAWIDDDPRNEQVIEVTRRALVFLCEALSVLDDRYAIYGFTGTTRKQCQVRVIKRFDEPYGTEVKGRIAGLVPGAYTRIGPAVRHVSAVLARQPARVRLLLLISDGRPNDFDGYGGRYGIEDTRRALLEARQRGLATFALTIDAEARDYMPYMFGPYQYVVVENAPALAMKLPEVYRRLTVH